MSAPVNFQFRDTQIQPSKEYRAVVEQAGTAAPTVTTTLLNSTGTTATWARTSAGVYTLTFGGATLTSGQTFVASLNISGTAVIVKGVITSTTVFTVNTLDAAGAATDLAGTIFIHLQVYPS